MPEPDEIINNVLADTKENLLPGGVGESTVPVDVRLLDSLMRLVGELVLTRNRIVSFAVGLREPSLMRASQRLDLIASELQADVMKTRMQPIENVWNTLPMVVTGLARRAGVEVALETSGQDTLLDKTVLEAIKDPMTELVTNAINHGIEPSQVRLAAGKNPRSVLRLAAFHDSGQVNIEISDDGAGLLADQVADRAAQRGLVTALDLSRMEDADKLDLVFLAGMSTPAYRWPYPPSAD